MPTFFGTHLISHSKCGTIITMLHRVITKSRQMKQSLASLNLTKGQLPIVIMLLLLILVGGGDLYAINTPTEGYDLNGSESIVVNAHGICKRLINSSDTSYFVPTKIEGDWTSFLSNLPVGVTTGSCCIDDVVQVTAGINNTNSCGAGCLDIWIGKVGDNYWGGWCANYELSQTIKVSHSGVITKAVINNAQWDDWMRIYIDNTLVWGGPYGKDKWETQCELSTSWNQNPNLDVTSYFSTAGTHTFKARVSVAGGGEGFARIRLTFDTTFSSCQ